MDLDESSLPRGLDDVERVHAAIVALIGLDAASEVVGAMGGVIIAHSSLLTVEARDGEVRWCMDLPELRGLRGWAPEGSLPLAPRIDVPGAAIEAQMAAELAQAFHSQSVGTIFLLADRIAPGREAAVFLHEIVHKHGPRVVGAAGMGRLIAGVKCWSAAPPQSLEQTIHAVADVRARVMSSTPTQYDEELFAYAVEEAVLRGVRPSLEGREGSAEQWLGDVVATLQGVVFEVARGAVPRLSAQGIVDLAYALAQLESPENGAKIRERLESLRAKARMDRPSSAPDRVPGWWATAEPVEATWESLERASGDAPYILEGHEDSSKVWRVADVPIDQIVAIAAAPEPDRQQERMEAIRKAEKVERPILEIRQDGMAHVLDGWHRLQVAKERGHKTISALVGMDPAVMIDHTGDPSAPLESQRKAFQDWFAGSKVVDADGKPLVVYHGTEEDFLVPDPQRNRDDFGFFATPFPQAAHSYAFNGPQKSGGQILPLYLSIKNPYVMDNDERIMMQMSPGEFCDGGIQGFLSSLKEGGYDGIKIEPWESSEDGGAHDGDDEEFGDVWVAFYPEQIKSAIGNRGTYDPSSPDIRFSFAGPKAATADLDALARAKAAAAIGQHAEKIRQETGWFVGVDGMWRFEIDDFGAIPKGVGTFGEVIMRWYQAGAERTGDVLYKTTVSDMLWHPRLYEAYPVIGDMELRMMPADHDSLGTLMVPEGEPPVGMIQEALPGNKWRSVLMHELQHRVQSIEGFASGGTIQNQSPAPAAAGTSEMQAQEEVQRAIYRRLAGEVEARNVQARLGMDAQARRNTSPLVTQDTPSSLQVVRYGRGGGPTLPSMDEEWAQMRERFRA